MGVFEGRLPLIISLTNDTVVVAVNVVVAVTVFANLHSLMWP